jgi:hypothetical protein
LRLSAAPFFRSLILRGARRSGRESTPGSSKTCCRPSAPRPTDNPKSAPHPIYTNRHLDPCIPESWPGFEVTLCRGSTRFDIRVDNRKGVAKGIASARIDNDDVTERPLRFDPPDDGENHEILVVMG